MNKRTGTREWSEHSVNCRHGCTNGCVYCYARAQALRFGRISSGDAWTEEVTAATPKIRLYRGRVMYPTAHDLTPANWAATGPVLFDLLGAGNDVLLVTKAHPDVMAALYARLLHIHRVVARAVSEGHLEIRVTIGALDPDILRFWEPGAPPPAARLEALRFIASWGIPTSVSIEPLLDANHVTDLVLAVAHWTDGEIWIGAANKLRARTAWCRGRPGLEEEILRIEAGQTPERMREVYKALRSHPQVRWKDSYQRVLGIDAEGREATP